MQSEQREDVPVFMQVRQGLWKLSPGPGLPLLVHVQHPPPQYLDALPPPEELLEDEEELEEELQLLQDEYLVVPPQVQEEAPEAFPQEQDL